MKTVKVKNIVIGEGKPKICVPIVGTNLDDIISQAEIIKDKPVDIVEWRVDWFKDVGNVDKVLTVLEELVKGLKDIPILFTFRSLKEGGKSDLRYDDYCEILRTVAKSGLIDLIDVEVYSNENINLLIKEIRSYDVRVVASSHDFNKTPSKDEIIKTLKYMQEVDADIIKIAVMPNSKRDVLELLSATLEMKENYTDRPMITISMGEMGVVTRIASEMFGSDVTFGAVGEMSAPGQIEVEELRTLLDVLHDNVK